MRIHQITLATMAALTSIACASTQTSTIATSEAQLQSELERLERTVRERDRAIEEQQTQVSRLTERLEQSSSSPVSNYNIDGGELLPPNAKPGQCYARVHVPAQYQTDSERVLAKAASSRIEVEPARYETIEERVLVKEASSRLELIPARYETVEERVLVEPASTRLEEVPAVYGYEEERVLVKPAHTIWKKGRGPIEKVDDATGEIMCLVEVPAEYKTVKRRVEKEPASTRSVTIPAKYQTVQKRVMSTPPSTRSITIPAEYKTVQVRRLVEPPKERRIEIPAEYENVTRRVVVSEGRMAWRPVLCETNASPAVVAQIQRALKSAGHDPGPIDGRVGPQTLVAVARYQESERLPRGGLNFETIAALGVSLGR